MTTELGDSGIIHSDPLCVHSIVVYSHAVFTCACAAVSLAAAPALFLLSSARAREWPLHSSVAFHSSRTSHGDAPGRIDPYAFNPYSQPTPLSPSSPTSSSPPPPSSSNSLPTGNSSDPSDALRHQILDDALKRVPLHGWSEEAIRASIEQLHLSSSLLSLFPSPVSSLISHFHSTSTSASLATLSSIPTQTLTTRDLLTQGLILQLQQHLPYLSHLPQLVGLSLTHDRVGTTLSDVAEYIDRLWYTIGDDSSDMTWYSKRAVVGAVYVTSTLHLITDRSAGQKDTWAFLDRRMREAEKAQRAPQDIAHALQQYGGAAYNLLASFMQTPSR